MSDSDDKTSRHNKLLLLRTRAVDEWDIQTLIKWSRDPDSGVRDWATFAIAVRDEDSDDVRQALLERAADSDLDVQSEALWGLARRRDARGLAFLIAALQDGWIGTLLIEAAAYFARPELVEPLVALGEWEDDPELLAEAIARCRGEQVERGRCWDIVSANDRD